MLISDILKYAMKHTNTPAQQCAAALGLSPQNFGQRMKRDTLNLEQLEKVLAECGLCFSITIRRGSVPLLNYCTSCKED